MYCCLCFFGFALVFRPLSLFPSDGDASASRETLISSSFARSAWRHRSLRTAACDVIRVGYTPWRVLLVLLVPTFHTGWVSVSAWWRQQVPSSRLSWLSQEKWTSFLLTFLAKMASHGDCNIVYLTVKINFKIRWIYNRHYLCSCRGKYIARGTLTAIHWGMLWKVFLWGYWLVASEATLEP